MSFRNGTDRANAGWPFRCAAKEVHFRRANFYGAAKYARVKES